jgi:hypothetical protein
MNMGGPAPTEAGPEGPEVDLEPLRKVYGIATRVLKLGRRWRAARFPATSGLSAPRPRFDHTSGLFITFLDANKDLSGFRESYLSSPAMKDLIRSDQPLSDAIRYLEYASDRVGGDDPSGSTEEEVAATLGDFEVARNILGEVLDDLEAEEDPVLIPSWDRKAKQLWYGDFLCREYRRTAPEQFQILDLFQGRDWKRTVPNPWRDEKKMRDTVGHINDGLLPGSPIQFEVFNSKPAWFRYRPRSGPDQLR